MVVDSNVIKSDETDLTIQSFEPKIKTNRNRQVLVADINQKQLS